MKRSISITSVAVMWWSKASLVSNDCCLFLCLLLQEDFAQNREFITLVVYKTDGKKVYYPGEVSLQHWTVKFAPRHKLQQGFDCSISSHLYIRQTVTARSGTSRGKMNHFLTHYSIYKASRESVCYRKTSPQDKTSMKWRCCWLKFISFFCSL